LAASSTVQEAQQIVIKALALTTNYAKYAKTASAFRFSLPREKLYESSHLKRQNHEIAAKRRKKRKIDA
jgi:hypothetical protein